MGPTVIMKWTQGSIDGVVLTPMTRHPDERGWLAELFREDSTPPGEMPVMGYVSVTHPGVTRGPHEHVEQTDVFGFAGPGNFRIRLWDNRAQSKTYGKTMTAVAGQDDPMIMRVPPGVVHGYTNVSGKDAWVLNFPDRLFRGPGRKQPVDEIRHEDTANTDFAMS